MGFPKQVVEDALVACGRCCCLCHKFCGVKMETEHIHSAAKGGPDTADNLIPLCFDCHAEVKHYNDEHPKGRKFSSSELKRHRDAWYERCAGSGGVAFASPTYLEPDRKILARLSTDGLKRSVAFMKGERYRGIFHNNELQPAENYYLRDARDVHEEFLDADLEQMRMRLVDVLGEFLQLLNSNLQPKGDSGYYFSIPNSWRDAPDGELEYTKLLDSLDKLAGEGVESYEALIRTARRKLGV